MLICLICLFFGQLLISLSFHNAHYGAQDLFSVCGEGRTFEQGYFYCEEAWKHRRSYLMGSMACPWTTEDFYPASILRKNLKWGKEGLLTWKQRCQSKNSALNYSGIIPVRKSNGRFLCTVLYQMEGSPVLAAFKLVSVVVISTDSIESFSGKAVFLSIFWAAVDQLKTSMELAEIVLIPDFHSHTVCLILK